MPASINSLLISVGILLILVISDPFIDSVAAMLRRAFLGREASSDPILDSLAEPQPVPVKERNAA